MDKRAGIVTLLVVMIAGLAAPLPAVHAEQSAAIALSGNFQVPDDIYGQAPLLIGLNDASGLFGADPDYIAPKDQQMLGAITGNALKGSYKLTVPDKPFGRPFDVTGSGKTAPGLEIFDVRLMTDVASRGYLAPNEDAIASSLNVDVQAEVRGGMLLVWAADDQQQFPTDYGADKTLFTADDPRGPLPAGWSLVNLDQSPFQVTRSAQVQLDLITSGGGARGVDYNTMTCAQLIPAILDRSAKTYPFTQYHHIDWNALRTQLVPQAQAAKSDADCEKLIRDIGNTLPDSHVNFSLPALRSEWAGSVGLSLYPLSSGQVAIYGLTPGGPADKAGIKLGALVTAWDGHSLNQAVKGVVLQYTNESTDEGRLIDELGLLARGTIGSTVQVTYQNPGEQPQTVSLTRQQAAQLEGVNLATPAVASNKLSSGIGYFRLRDFYEMPILRDLNSTVDGWIKDSVPAVIIDIRNNPGGLSQISDAMASRFFDKAFVSGRQLDPAGRVTYLDSVTPHSPIYEGCVVLLVNVRSVSAADLFAYTMHLQQRAVVVGHTGTAGGGGSVNAGDYEFLKGGFLQIPTGGFYNDQGKIVIEGVGVQPDIKVPTTIQSLTSPEDEVLDAGIKAAQSCSSHPATPAATTTP